MTDTLLVFHSTVPKTSKISVENRNFRHPMSHWHWRRQLWGTCPPPSTYKFFFQFALSSTKFDRSCQHYVMWDSSPVAPVTPSHQILAMSLHTEMMPMTVPQHLRCQKTRLTTWWVVTASRWTDTLCSIYRVVHASRSKKTTGWSKHWIMKELLAKLSTDYAWLTEI